MSEQALRFCPRPTWWRETLKLRQEDVSHAEQVECESFGKRYSKYAAVLKDGRDIICARVSDVLRDAIGFGENFIQWAVRQTLDDLRQSIEPWEAYSPAELAEAFARAEGARFRTAELAAELGTRAHELIERFLRTGRFGWVDGDGEYHELDMGAEEPQVARAIKAFMEFYNREKFEVVAIEKWLVDVTAGYGGAIDCVARNKNGELVLLDWKTSKAVRDKYLLQVTAYELLWQASGEQPISRAYIVRLDKETAEIQMVPVFVNEEEREYRRSRWRAVLETYRGLRADKKYLEQWGRTDA